MLPIPKKSPRLTTEVSPVINFFWAKGNSNALQKSSHTERSVFAKSIKLIHNTIQRPFFKILAFYYLYILHYLDLIKIPELVLHSIKMLFTLRGTFRHL